MMGSATVVVQFSFEWGEKDYDAESFAHVFSREFGRFCRSADARLGMTLESDDWLEVSLNRAARAAGGYPDLAMEVRCGSAVPSVDVVGLLNTLASGGKTDN